MEQVRPPAPGRSLLVDDLGVLVTNDPRRGPLTAPLRDAAVVVQDGRFAWVGPRAHAPECDERFDAGGRDPVGDACITADGCGHVG